MRRIRVLLHAAACLIVAAGLEPAAAQTIPLQQRITHPNGASIQLQGLELHPDSIVLSAILANPTGREIRFNRSRSFALRGGAHGVHRLNPPFDNPALAIPAHSEASANLVFIGPLAPAAGQLTLSTNAGIGTADNPYDDAPVFRATLPVAQPAGNAGAVQADHPDGVILRVRHVAIGAGRCVVSLLATNGNERTIVLNQGRSMVLSGERGAAAPLEAPAENVELVVPSGNRLDAELVFDCGRIEGGPLMLNINRGTAGTPDNPYETLPVFALRLSPEPLTDGAGAPSASSASVAPIARSALSASPATVAASRPPEPAAQTARPAAPSPEPQNSRAKRTLPQLEAALHAEKTDRGLRLVVPADELFGAKQGAFGAAAAASLASLAELIAAMQPREVVVLAHTDSTGNDKDNLALSEERAHAVVAWLDAHAGQRRRPHFVAEGYGRTRPVAPNHKSDGSDNPEGRAQNRRVEILLRRR